MPSGVVSSVYSDDHKIPYHCVATPEFPTKLAVDLKHDLLNNRCQLSLVFESLGQDDLKQKKPLQ